MLFSFRRSQKAFFFPKCFFFAKKKDLRPGRDLQPEGLEGLLRFFLRKKAGAAAPWPGFEPGSQA
jgi:hypothetical protein